eukprot:gene16089-4874_t
MPSVRTLARHARSAAKRFRVPFHRALRSLTSACRSLLNLRDILVRYPAATQLPPTLTIDALLKAFTHCTLSPPTTPSPSQRVFSLSQQREDAPSATWKPLGSVGNHCVAPHRLRDAFTPLSHPFRSPQQPVRSKAPTEASTCLIFDLRRHNLLRDMPPGTPPSGSITIVPKNASKARAIFNLRPLNQQQHLAPKPFKLPTFDSLKGVSWALPSLPLYFTCVDLANYFYGLRLPGEYPDSFVFQHGPESLSLRCLPFGWNGSPHVAQSISTSVVGRALRESYTLSQVFYDDILCASPAPDQLHRDTQKVISGLTSNQLVVHPTKTKPGPSHTADWIGKRLTSSGPSRDHTCLRIENTVHSGVTMLAQTALALAFRPSKRQLQRVAGAVTWGGIHHRLSLPFLNALHAHTFSPAPARELPASTTDATLYAAALACVPWSGFGFNTVLTPHHVTVYCDGAHSSKASSTGVFIPALGLARFTPVRCPDQQHAELISALHGLALAGNHSLTRIHLLLDSQSTIGSLFKLSTRAHLRYRARALQKIAHIVLVRNLNVCVSYVPSKHNAADPLTRLGLSKTAYFTPSQGPHRDALSIYGRHPPAQS